MRPAVARAREVCPVEVAVAVLGGKWKLTVVKNLMEHDVLRSHELLRLLPHASERTMTRQLRELEADGVVIRTVYPEVPPRVEYSLTPRGRSLDAVVAAMDQWGKALDSGP